MTLGTCSCSPVGDIKVIDIYIVKNSLTFLTLIPLHLYVDLSGTARVKQDISWSFPIFCVNTYFHGKWLNDMERPKITFDLSGVTRFKTGYFLMVCNILCQNTLFFICVRIYSIKISRLKFRKFLEYFIVHSRLGFEKNIIWCVEKL